LIQYHGDFVALASKIPAADIVTLDFVICCYHDMEALVGLSAEHARRFLALVYPRDTPLMKTADRVANLIYRLRRSDFLFYLYPSEAIDAVARSSGLQPLFDRKIYLGQAQMSVYAR
jgi:magnesium-protoporphyrin O-methyltransferase